MGWSSGTELFDGVMDAVIELIDPDNTDLIQEAVDRIYKVFYNSDWDTQDESEYFIPYLVNAMYKLGELDDADLHDYLDG